MAGAGPQAAAEAAAGLSMIDIPCPPCRANLRKAEAETPTAGGARFRTIQVGPKDLPAPLLREALARAHGCLADLGAADAGRARGTRPHSPLRSSAPAATWFKPICQSLNVICSRSPRRSLPRRQRPSAASERKRSWPCGRHIRPTPPMRVLLNFAMTDHGRCSRRSPS